MKEGERTMTDDKDKNWTHDLRFGEARIARSGEGTDREGDRQLENAGLDVHGGCHPSRVGEGNDVRRGAIAVRLVLRRTTSGARARPIRQRPRLSPSDGLAD